MALDAEAKRKLKAYQSELRIKRTVNVVGYSLVTVATLLLAMVLSGDRFQTVLSYLGIEGMSNAETGVYADCSRAANRNVAYCQPKISPEKSWKTLRGGANSPAFDLNGK